MKRKKKKKQQKRFSWHYFLIGAFLGLTAIGLFFFQKKFTSEYLGKVDTLVNNYIPPGAIRSKINPQKPEIIPLGNQTVRVPILLYHYLEYNRDVRDTIRTSLAVTPFWFGKQLEYLKENGYQTITFGDLYNAVRRKGKLPKKPVILTFDDGYRDFYTDAFPLLKKYKAKATVFVIPGFLDKPNYLYSWQLKEIATDSSHLVTIGAHTMHHPALTSLNLESAYQEILESKLFLEKNFARPVTVFNYPYGLHDDHVQNLVKKAGFQMAVSTILGESESLENRYVLPRIRVGNYTGSGFEARLNIDQKY